MKKIFGLMILMVMMVGAFATPRLEGNKIYLDEAKTSLFTAEQFIANVGDEEALDISDEVGHTKRMQLELFTNPNKVIEFATEETAKQYYEVILSLGDELVYCAATDHYEDVDFIAFIELSNGCTTPGCTPVYCYVGE